MTLSKHILSIIYKIVQDYYLVCYNIFIYNRYTIMKSDVLYSVIIGIVVALVLFFLFSDKEIYRGPNSKEVKSAIFRSDNKCYEFEPKVYVCPKQ